MNQMERSKTVIFDISDIQLISIVDAWKQEEGPIGITHKLIGVSEGSAAYHLPDDKGVIGKGEMLVLPSGFRQLTLMPASSSFSFYCVEFAAASVCRSGDSWSIENVASLPVQGIMNVRMMPIVHHQMKELYACWRREAIDMLHIQMSFAKLWKTLITAAPAGNANRKAASKAMFHSIAEHMDRHSDETFQIEEMARLSGMTPASFYRQFKEHTSFTPLQYLTLKRMDKACRLLVTDEAKVHEVAKAVGYHDVYYFSRLFKKTIGIPPFHYMRSLRKKIAVLNSSFIGDLIALGVPNSCIIAIEAAECDVERLRKEQPDWIIGTEAASAWENQLKEIAPTQLIAFKQASWREHLIQLASYIGVQEVADTWLHYYDLKVSAARERIRKGLRNETVIAARVGERGIRVFGANRRKVGAFLYGDLQINAPAGIDGFHFEDMERIEELNDFKADHILLLGDKARLDIGRKEIRGKVHYASLYPWLHYSALGHEQAIAEAIARFSDDAAIRNIHAINQDSLFY